MGRNDEKSIAQIIKTSKMVKEKAQTQSKILT